MKRLISINNRFVEEASALVSVDDRSFLFGDGIFETCKIFAGKIYDFKSHKKRLKAGLKALCFSAEIENLETESLRLIQKNQVKNGLLKIEISRGSGGVGYSPNLNSKASIVIRTFDERVLPNKVSLGISAIKKPPKNSFPIHCKTKQALPFILTKIAAQKENLFDLVMLSQKNFISETSSANIFWIKNGKVFTPEKSCDILPGTARERLLKISPIKIFEVRKKISELENADEIFLTNSSFLVLPVDEFVFGSKKKTVKKLQKNFGTMFLEIMKQDVENSCRA